MKYSARSYSVSQDFLSDVTTIKSRKTLGAVFLIWASVLGLVFFSKWLMTKSFFWYFYLPIGIFIAGRQGALLQIVHEGSHHLISKNHWLNNFVGNWLAALPVGLTLDGYTKGHLQHHAHTNTEEDLPTDREKYSSVSFKNRKLYILFLKDLFGITALKSFLGHNNREKSISQDSRIVKLFKLGIAQSFVILIVFQLQFYNYLLLWVWPLIGLNMVLLRIRGIAEHGGPTQLGINITSAAQGNFYTRSVLTPYQSPNSKLIHALETLLIGSLSCNYHHEHHLFPKVPFYNLKKIHQEIAVLVSANNDKVYVEGYFKAFFIGAKEKYRL